MTKKTVLFAFIAAALLLNTACLNLQVKSDVDYPGKLFKKTMKNLKAIQAKDPQRKGPVSKLNFLVYIGAERKLLSFAVPTGIAKMALENDSALPREELKKYTNHDVDIDWEGLKGFEKLGPGLLAEIEVAEDEVHLICWLD